jgi:hypothetical protein
MTNVAVPRVSESPIFALSETISAGSTTTLLLFCSSRHAGAGSVMMLP